MLNLTNPKGNRFHFILPLSLATYFLGLTAKWVSTLTKEIQSGELEAGVKQQLSQRTCFPSR